ncbi:dienelactone hydrolase family protein [Phenylobacterium sp.]|jgi:carboxymethylenebutenolidase|uniref:dienelactone hydrolase family protein n=1 Tax=Phenylobacterium sp. TaxID=1871053 RepID=UPI002E353CEF|nr:dienelactone hydrolase family protein [Phenylobacterium sp.]HEX3366010.1 dienelactone hydrolase family protein [Phenylobacterium sp.]
MAASMVSLRTDAGSSFGAYLAKPDRPNDAGVVILQEIFGVNANMRSVADAWASVGFTAIVPDLFWRQQPGVELDPATDRERATELMRGLNSDLAVQDALLAAAYVCSLHGANGKVGAVGYCLGGKLAYLLSMQAGIDFAASYYGVGIQGALDQMGAVRCPLLLHLAEEDQLCPPEAQAAIERAATPHSNRVEVMRYPGVGHAFARRGSPVFDQQSAERADTATRELLRTHLVGAS